jgi:hypothetical protein
VVEYFTSGLFCLQSKHPACRYLSHTDSNYGCVNVPLRLQLKALKFQFHSTLVGDRIIASLATRDNKYNRGLCICFGSDSNPRLHCIDVSGHSVTMASDVGTSS